MPLHSFPIVPCQCTGGDPLAEPSILPPAQLTIRRAIRLRGRALRSSDNTTCCIITYSQTALYPVPYLNY